jgi:rhamnogalacturonan acetylesterase
VNKAVAGRSARSYWNEGKFQAIADLVVAGDYVLLCVIVQTVILYAFSDVLSSEFGHNDGGSLSTTDNGRTDCYGGGSETCISPTTGETVYTYVFYLLQAGYVYIRLQS